MKIERGIVILLRAILFFTISYYVAKGINFHLKCNEFERRFNQINRVKPEESLEEFLATSGMKYNHTFYKKLKIGRIKSIYQNEIYELTRLTIDILIYQDILQTDRVSLMELTSILQNYSANSSDRMYDLANKSIDLAMQYQAKIGIISN